MDNYKTPVIFRKWNNGNVIALFPTIPANNTSLYACMSYEYVGQHGAANYNGVIDNTKPAKLSEWAELAEELKSLGYNLRVYQKRTSKLYDEFLDALAEYNKMLEEEN